MDLYMPITLLPGNSLSNSDFTGLMQALQRPLQPTLHMAVSLSVGGTPSFTPGSMQMCVRTKSRDVHRVDELEKKYDYRTMSRT